MTAAETRVVGAGSGHEEGEGFFSEPGTAKEADVNLRAIRHELGITAELTELAKVRHWVRTVLRGLPASVGSTLLRTQSTSAPDPGQHGPRHRPLRTSVGRSGSAAGSGAGAPGATMATFTVRVSRS